MAVWWLLPVLTAGESHPPNHFGVAWFSMVFYRNVLHKLIVIYVPIYLFS